MTQTETTKLFDAHFRACTYAKGSAHLLSIARSGVEEESDDQIDAFYFGMRLLFFSRRLADAQEHLDEIGSQVKKFSSEGKRVFLLVKAEYHYRQGRYLSCYDLVRQIFREIYPIAGDISRKSKLLRGRFGLNLHHLAGRASARMGNSEMARIHYGFAFSFGFNELRFGQVIDHYLLGSITLDYMRTYLDDRQPEYCEMLLENAESHYKTFLAEGDRVGQNGQRHLIQLELLYWKGRMLTKERAEGWFAKVKQLAQEMEGIRLAYDNHPVLSLDPRINFLLGGAHMVKAETLLRKNNGQPSEAIIVALLRAWRNTKAAVARQSASATSSKDPLLCRGLNFLIRIDDLLGRLQEEGTEEKREAENEMEDCISQAYICNLLKDDREDPPGSEWYNDYRQAFKTAKEEMRSRLARVVSPEERYQLTRIAYDKCYHLLLMGFSHCSSASARASRYYDFRSVKENMIEAAYDRLNDKQKPSGKERNAILEHLLAVFTHTDKQDWNLRYAAQDEENDIDIDATNLPRVRTMEKAFFRMFRDGFESLSKHLGRGDYRRYNTYAYELLNEHLRRLDRKNPPKAKRYDVPSPRFELNRRIFFKNFSDAQNTGVYCVFKGTRHLYCLCGSKKRGGKGELTLKRLTTVAYADLRVIDKAVKTYNSAVAKLVAHEGESMPLQLKYVTKGPERSVAQDERANVLNRNYLISSYELYDHLIKPLGIGRHHRLYFLFKDYNFQRICLPALFPRPAAIDNQDSRIMFSALKYLGVTHEVASVPSLIDFLEGERRETADRKPMKNEVLLAHLSFDRSNARGISTHDRNISGLMKSTTDVVERHLKKHYPNLFTGHTVCRYPQLGLPTYLKTDKAKLLANLNSARSFFIFTHSVVESRHYVPRVRKNHRTQKLLLRIMATKPGADSPNSGEERVPWYLADANDEYALYYDDFDYRKYPRLKFSFLACCASAHGNELKGYIPRSVLSTFVEGGCSATVGTLFNLHDETIRDFATCFIEVWLGRKNVTKENKATPLADLEVGTALRATREKLSQSGIHPLSWGAFLLMGRQSVRCSDAFGITRPQRSKH